MTTPDAPSILVVDDDLFIRNMFSLMLTRAGYQVTTAADGRDALEQIVQRRPDLIVLDYMMPRLNGIEVLNHLVLEPRTASIPVLIVSAAIAAKELALEPVTQKMTVAMLPKPVGMQQILDNVAHLLSSVPAPVVLPRQPHLTSVV